MRCLLAVLLLSVTTVFAMQDANLEYQSGDDSNIPQVTDDEDMEEGSGSGGTYFVPETSVKTTVSSTPESDYPEEAIPDLVPEEELENEVVVNTELLDTEDETEFYDKIEEKEEVDIEIDLEEEKVLKDVNNDKKFIDGKVTSEGDFDLQPKDPVIKTSSSSSVFSGHFLTAAIIGGCVGFLFAVALIMLLLYRMRKKDEGSYALDDQKKHGAPPAYQYTQGQEYYA